MNYYISEFQKILNHHQIDALLVYSSAYDDRFLKAIAGVPSLLDEYILITPNQALISQMRSLVADTQKKTNLPVLSAISEYHLVEPLKDYIKPKSRLGIVGKCPYQDVVSLSPTQVTDFTNAAQQIIKYKSDDYIQNVAQVAKAVHKFITNVKIKVGMSQTEIAQQLKQQMISHDYTLAFPLCITSGEDLKISTSMPANPQKFIQSTDAICIDFGIKKGIYTTDITRMYFLNNSQPAKLYEQICQIQDTIINQWITPHKTFPQLIAHYKQQVESLPDVVSLQELGFGHGIGFGLHEYPGIENADEKIGTNIVFTLEPTVHTTYGRIRTENMISIDSKGTVNKITQE